MSKALVLVSVSATLTLAAVFIGALACISVVSRDDFAVVVIVARAIPPTGVRVANALRERDPARDARLALIVRHEPLDRAQRAQDLRVPVVLGQRLTATEQPFRVLLPLQVVIGALDRAGDLVAAVPTLP